MASFSSIGFASNTLDKVIRSRSENRSALSFYTFRQYLEPEHLRRVDDAVEHIARAPSSRHSDETAVYLDRVYIDIFKHAER